SPASIAFSAASWALAGGARQVATPHMLISARMAALVSMEFLRLDRGRQSGTAIAADLRCRDKPDLFGEGAQRQRTVALAHAVGLDGPEIVVAGAQFVAGMDRPVWIVQRAPGQRDEIGL